MKELELDKPKENMFYKALNPEYGKLFQEVFDAGLDDRDRLMLEIYEKSKDDPSLDDKKKKIVAGTYLAHINAVCDGCFCGPLMFFYDKKKPNLKKFYGEHRLVRCVEDLYTIVNRSGFDCRPELMPELTKALLASYGYGTKVPFIEDQDAILMILLSRFARAISPTDYKNMWFVVDMIKNISLNAYATPEYLGNNMKIFKQRTNLAKFIITIYNTYFKDKPLVPDVDIAKTPESTEREI